MIKCLKLYTITLLIAVSYIFLSSFRVSSSQSIAIHFDRPFYLNGDRVYFKIYFFEFIGSKTFLEIQVENSTNKDQCNSFFIPVINQMGYGSFSIPHTAGTSIWNIQAQWFDRINSKVNRLFKSQIKVFNDMDGTLTKSSVPIPKPVVSSGSIMIHSDKPFYHPGEKTTINIKTLDQNGNPVRTEMSISVFHSPYLVSDGAPISSVNAIPVESMPKAENSLSWTRKVINQDTELPLSNEVIAVFLKNEGKIVLAKIDDEGVFSWKLPPFYGNKPIQYFDPLGRNIKVLPLTATEDQIQDESKIISIDLKKYFEDNRIRKKINFLFKGAVQSKRMNIGDTSHWPFKPDFTLHLKNYEKVRSIRELTKLILTPLRINKSENGLIAKMVDPLNKPFFNGPPLFIIDRCLEPDMNKALAMNYEHIIRIDFYNRPQSISHFSHVGRHGVVSISTKFPQLYQSNTSEIIKGIAEEGKERNTLMMNQNIKGPAIYPLVYWNPELKTNQNGEATIIFNQSDDLGTFVIEVFAISSGGFSHARQKYNVVTR